MDDADAAEAEAEGEGAKGTGTRGWRTTDAARCAACRPSASGAPCWGLENTGVLCEPCGGVGVGVAQPFYIIEAQALAQVQQAPSLWLGSVQCLFLAPSLTLAMAVAAACATA